VQPTPIVTDVIQRKAKAHRKYNGEHQGFVVFHCVSFLWLEQHIVLNAVVDTEALATSTYP
jgi:hypothetical protein